MKFELYIFHNFQKITPITSNTTIYYSKLHENSYELICIYSLVVEGLLFPLGMSHDAMRCPVQCPTLTIISNTDIMANVELKRKSGLKSSNVVHDIITYVHQIAK